MAKTYPVIFAANSLPGVHAVGHIKRGDTVKVEAAEALRLVNVKGLAFVDAADAKAAASEVQALQAQADASAAKAAAKPDAVTTTANRSSEEH